MAVGSFLFLREQIKDIIITHASLRLDIVPPMERRPDRIDFVGLLVCVYVMNLLCMLCHVVPEPCDALALFLMCS
jgi:hypothetical protein